MFSGTPFDVKAYERDLASRACVAPGEPNSYTFWSNSTYSIDGYWSITAIIGASLVPGLPNMYSTPSDSNIFKRACLPAMRVNYWVLLCAYC